MSRSLGIDMGKRRVGIALSDTLNIIASPFKTLTFIDDKDQLSEINRWKFNAL